MTPSPPRPRTRAWWDDWDKKPRHELALDFLGSLPLAAFENRCRNSRFHNLLPASTRERYPFNHPALSHLLSRTPKFIPTPSRLDLDSIETDAWMFSFRCALAHQRWRDISTHDAQRWDKSFGLKPFFPLFAPLSRVSLPTRFRRIGISRQLAALLTTIRNDAQCHTRTIRARPLPRSSRLYANLPSSSREVLKALRLETGIGYNVTDKNLGSVLYPRDLYLAHCQSHLRNPANYLEVTDPPDIICAQITRRFNTALRRLGLPSHLVKRMGLHLSPDHPARLCQFYILFKLHKPQLSSRPITSNLGWITANASRWLHQQLVELTMKQSLVLKDTAQLCQCLRTMTIPHDSDAGLLCADVEALYPSIQPAEGLVALELFCRRHLQDHVADMIVGVAAVVLDNTYLECPGIGCFRQISGVAMGTSFAVVYAIIYMLHIETPVVEEYDAHILLYKRFLDDVFLLWHGCRHRLGDFMAKLNRRHPSIKLTWSSTANDLPAQQQVDFMDLTVSLSRDPPIHPEPRLTRVNFRLFRKPRNLHQYLPFNSFHPRHTFRGWVKAELLRLRSHSSTKELYLSERSKFWGLLRARGYPSAALRSFFLQVSWEQGSSRPPRTKPDFKGCVWTSVHRPGTDDLRRSLDLSFSSLPEDQLDAHPSRGLFALRSAPRLGSIIGR